MTSHYFQNHSVFFLLKEFTKIFDRSGIVVNPSLIEEKRYSVDCNMALGRRLQLLWFTT